MEDCMKTWIDLTDRFPIKFDLSRMKEEIKKVEQSNWLGHYDQTLSSVWKVLPLVSLEGKMDNSEEQRPGPWDQYKRTKLLDSMPYHRWILDSLKCPQARVRLMKLHPKGFITPHRDIDLEVANLAFNKVRLHVPVYTNDKVIFYVGREKFHMKEGHIYYVNFSKVHSVRNDGNSMRIHLVIDLEVNDWLAQFFPPLTRAEKVEGTLLRATLPVFWKMHYMTKRLRNTFWRSYEGSRLQKTYHSLKGSAAPN